MNELTELPNIGKILSDKLNKIGITNSKELVDAGSEKIILQLSTIPDSGSCLNMLYAIEGAIQGIRWHSLDIERKNELKDFYNSFKK